MTDDLTVRASSLTGYSDCPRRWAAQQLSGLLSIAGYTVRSIPQNIGALIGSGTHSAVAADMQHKLDHDELPPLQHSIDAGMAELEARMAEADGVNYDEVSPDLSDAQMQVRRLARAYRDQIGHYVEPVVVERRLKALHPTGLILSGQQDLVVARPRRLRDVKTGKQQRANFAQYGAYSRLLRAHGEPVGDVLEDFVKRVPLRKAQPPVLTKTYDVAVCEQQAETTLQAIARDLAQFKLNGDRESFLANPASAMCGDRFCPAHGTSWCPLGRKDD